MEKPKEAASTMNALVIGDSPTMLYLGYALSYMQGKLTLFPYTDRNINYTRQRSILSGGCKYQYRAHNQLRNLIDLSKLVQRYEARNIKFQYILINAKFLEYITKISSKFLQNVIGPDTLILIDSPGVLFELFSFETVFPGTVVLVLCSNIDCRLIDSKSNNFRSVGGKQIKVGTPYARQTRDTADCLELRGGKGENLSVLQSAYQEAFSCTLFEIISPFSHEILTKYLWKNTIKQICCDYALVFFEEPSIKSLVSHDKSEKLIYGLFYEVSSIYGAITIGHKEDLVSVGAKKYFLELCNQEKKNLLKKRNQTSHPIPKNQLTNKTYYDYIEGYELNIIPQVSKLIKIGTDFNIEVPSLQQLLKHFLELAKLVESPFIVTRDSLSHTFQLKKREPEFVQLETVNGIPPEKNMMNFFPFNPLPPPIPLNHNYKEPIVYMCQFDKSESPLEEQQEDFIDPVLQDLVVGQESFTYGKDTYYDAEPAVLVHGSPDLPKEELIVQCPEEISQTGFLKRATYLKDSAGNFHLLQQDGTIIALTPFAPFLAPMNNPRGMHETSRSISKPFYHVPTPITKNTSPQKLRISQTHLIKQIQFDRIASKGSHSRYGELDTLTRAMNSKFPPPDEQSKPPE